jgi:hypothetical protein
MYANTPKDDRELEVFRGFVEASHLAISPESIRHRPEPEPDILCTVTGDDQYFELSEVLWEAPGEPGRTIMKGYYESERAARRKAALIAEEKLTEADQVVTAGGLGYPPLVSLKQSLARKTAKSYALHDRPCSLLLFYANQNPMEPYDLLFDCQDVLIDLLAPAAFDTVWIYRHSFSNWISLQMGDPDFAALGHRPIPLRDFHRSSDRNAVIGRIALDGGHLSMSFDATYSALFYQGLGDLNAALGT